MQSLGWIEYWIVCLYFTLWLKTKVMFISAPMSSGLEYSN